MSKQDIIKEAIDHYADDGCFYPSQDCEHRGGEYCVITERAYECLVKRLDELGVVIKVDKPFRIGESVNDDGLVAVEPLIPFVARSGIIQAVEEVSGEVLVGKDTVASHN